VSDHVHHVFDGMCVYCQAEELERLTAERDALRGALRRSYEAHIDPSVTYTPADLQRDIEAALRQKGEGE